MKITPSTRNSMNTLISRTRYLNSNYSGISDVKDVERVNPASNYSASHSQVLSKESFYDKLEKKEDQNRKNFEKDRNTNSRQRNTIIMTKEDRETIAFLKKLFVKFNNTMERIKKIDMARNQNHFQDIKREINLNSRFLSDIGIYTDKLYHFYINEEVFVDQITRDPIKINRLLDPQSGVIKRLCDSFGGMLQ